MLTLYMNGSLVDGVQAIDVSGTTEVRGLVRDVAAKLEVPAECVEVQNADCDLSDMTTKIMDTGLVDGDVVVVRPKVLTEGKAVMRMLCGPTSIRHKVIILQLVLDSEPRFDVTAVFFEAIRLNCTPIVEMMPPAYANCVFQGRTALHVAAECGHVETVEVLLREGAVDSCDSCGQTALQQAEMFGHVEVAELLASQLGVIRASPVAATHSRRG